MKFQDLLEARNPGHRPGEPYWEHNNVDKTYTVYDQDDNIVSQYPYKDVWNSSPARNAAQKDLTQLVLTLRNKNKADAAAKDQLKPLSDLEKRYQDILGKYKRYLEILYPKDKSPSILDKETKDIYHEQCTKWLTELERLSSGNTIRSSVLDGTYKG